MNQRNRHHHLIAALLLISLGSPLAAQEGQALFGETVEVEVINVEVVVTDKDGRPVTGLEAGDFQLFDNKKPVEITNFYEVVGGVVPNSATSAAPAEAEAPARPLGSTQGLNLVIFVDNLNMMPGNRKLLFENLRAYLRTAAASIDRAMVVSMRNRVEVVLPFTTDMGAVLTAVDEVEGHTSFEAAMDGEQKIFLSRLQRGTKNAPAGGVVAPSGQSTGVRCGGPNFEDSIRVALDLASTSRTIADQRYSALRAAVSALSGFSSTLGGLPGRKALLYLSDGLSVRPNDMLREAWAVHYEGWVLQNESAIRNCQSFPDAGQVFQNMITGLGSSQFDLHEEFDRFAANASDNQVTLYPISVSGRGSSIITAEGSGPTGAVLRAARTTEAESRDASMLQMAADTGGVARTGSPNIAGLLDQMSEDFGYYYSLGYTQTGDRDTDFHRFEVKVDRPDLEVRHAKGRHRKSWRDRLGDMTAAAALFSIETNPLGIRLTPGEPARHGKRYKVPLMVQIPFQSLQMVSDGKNYSAELTVLVTVSDEKGGLSEPERFDLPIRIPNAQILAARAQAAAYPMELEMDGGLQRVAVSVRDHIAQNASVVSLEIQVGDAKAEKGKKRRKR